MPRKPVVTQYISLDGVIEDPVGMENSGLGDWTGPFQRGPEGDAFKIGELFSSDAVLLGRVTYDAFAAVWPAITDETGFAERINTLPKYVPSRTLAGADWNNTTVWRGDVAEEVRKLKVGEGGDILVYGSAMLVHALVGHGLVDAFNLMVYPVVLGRGKRLFPDGTRLDLALEESRLLGSGIALLRYRKNDASLPGQKTA
jgi:dihydrofolate reductase